MYGKKFYENYVKNFGLDSFLMVQLDKDASKFYFSDDYCQPMTGFWLSRFDDFGGSVFKFVLITGDIEYNSAGRPESIEYAVDTPSGLEFKRFYFNNPYGDKIYLIYK